MLVFNMTASRITCAALAIPFALSFTACRAQDTAAANPTQTPADRDPTTQAPAVDGSQPPARGSSFLITDRAGIECTADSGNNSCTAGNLDTGDYYDVELHAECDASGGLVAGVTQTDGVDALARVPATGSDGQSNGHLPQGQLMCVQATGRIKEKALYYFVQALASSQAPASCKSDSECAAYAAKARPTCNDASAGQCIHGWVSAAALRTFDNTGASREH